MMKQFFKFSTLSLIILLGFSSCSSDSDDRVVIPNGDFENGYIVSNEGNFTDSNASVSFITNDLIEKTDMVFKSINGDDLGDVLQCIAFDGDYAFLVINYSNKIEVVNRYTFKRIVTLTEHIKGPRYAVVKNGKLYVTNSGMKSVEVFDAKSFDHITTIDVNRSVEEIKEANGMLYVMNASYGTGKDITIIDTNTNEVIKTISVQDGLNSIEIDNGILYALHKTGITKINTSNNEIIGEIPLADGLTNVSKLEISDNHIYFISGSKIFKYSTDVTVLANTELVDTKVSDGQYNIGYGFSVVGNRIFYSDVKGFTANSEVKVYDLDGKFLKSFTAGMGVNAVYGNN